MVNSVIYIEGGTRGRNSKAAKISCQRAFNRLLDRMGLSGRKPRLKACGGRDSVYKDFCIANASRTNNYVAMLIDSEEPVADCERTWAHLSRVKTVKPWQQPEGTDDEQVLFMTTCMETWIVADRNAMRKHFGSNLYENQLPSLEDLESQDRHAVQDSLVKATSNCGKKYRKGVRSYELVEKLDVDVLEQHLPSCRRVRGLLRKKLGA